MRLLLEECPVTRLPASSICRSYDTCELCDLFKSSIVGKHTELKARSSQKHIYIMTNDDSVVIQIEEMTITVDKNLKVIVSSK